MIDRIGYPFLSLILDRLGSSKLFHSMVFTQLNVDQACWFLMGLRSGISVSDGSPIRHVGL